MATRKLSFYRGTILNPMSDKRCDYLVDGVMVVESIGKAPGKIVDLLTYTKACAKYLEELTSDNVHEYVGDLIVPGFFDMHFHWVQDDVRLMPKDSLLSWLEKYTFPTEERYASRPYAQRQAKKFFKRLTQVGTLGGACYSSIHEHALRSAMGEVLGDVLIGNVLMTMESPKGLTQIPKLAREGVLKSIKKYGKRYILTPRFAIATDPATMSATAQLADRHGIFKQSHLSETPGEIDFVLKQYRGFPGFENVKSYTEIYQRVGMLGERSLMAHGIHLSSAELKILRDTHTSLIHCPTSNAPLKQKGLGSGLFNFKAIEKSGIRWALGSDIGGGPYLSMLDVMKSFVSQNHKAKRSGATYVKALYRSTLAGAQILGLEKRCGNFAKGKEANFVVLKGQGKKKLNAEAALKGLMGSIKKRDEADHQVRATYWQGKRVYASRQS